MGEGYDNGTLSRRNQVAFWIEEEEEKLRRTFDQLKLSQESKELEGMTDQEDILDTITSNFEDSGKTKRQIIKKLKQLELITDISEVSASSKSKASFWSAAEKELLERIFRETNDYERSEETKEDEPRTVLEQICDKFRNKGKSKRQIVKMIKELGLVNDIKEIGSIKDRSSIWNKDDTEKLLRVFSELKEYMNVEDTNSKSKKVLIDSIIDHFEDSGKSKRQIVKKLKDMNLIENDEKIRTKSKKVNAKSKASTILNSDDESNNSISGQEILSSEDNASSEEKDKAKSTEKNFNSKLGTKITLSSDDDSDETSQMPIKLKRNDLRKKAAKGTLKFLPKAVENDTSENDSESELKFQSQFKERNQIPEPSFEDDASAKLQLSSTKKRKPNKLSSDEEGDEISLMTYEFKRNYNRKKNTKKALKSSPKMVRNDTSENDS